MPQGPSLKQMVGALAAIGVSVGGSAAAFAYTAGWLNPSRLTPERIVDALGHRGGDPVGHRRNHSKGVCFTGTLDANGAGTRLSTARVFAPGSYPVTGRFAIALGNPAAPDSAGRVRSMAIRVTTPDGQEWRSGINNSPVFVVATPQAFYEATLAAAINPATGKPDPQANARFIAAHPETIPFNQWAKTAPWTTSFADQSYNSLNAFRLVDAGGSSHAVRWSMQATTPMQPAAQAQLAQLGPEFLSADLEQRLAAGPLRWRLVVTLAAPTDPTDDATKAWPADREQVDVGTLVIRAAQDEANGPCRDINFDPTILPTGIEISDDKLLPARSSAYANSFDRRTTELGLGTRAAALEGQP
ncbi:MAG: catalase family peroxidase [Janthinobacterium lividum]